MPKCILVQWVGDDKRQALRVNVAYELGRIRVLPKKHVAIAQCKGVDGRILNARFADVALAKLWVEQEMGVKDLIQATLEMN